MQTENTITGNILNQITKIEEEERKGNQITKRVEIKRIIKIKIKGILYIFHITPPETVFMSSLCQLYVIDEKGLLNIDQQPFNSIFRVYRSDFYYHLKSYYKYTRKDFTELDKAELDKAIYSAYLIHNNYNLLANHDELSAEASLSLLRYAFSTQ